MNNDLDVTRAILISIRDREVLWPKAVELPGLDTLVVARHVERLHDDGFIDGTRHRYLADPAATILVRDLTTAGHQFLAAMENDGVWSKLKSALTPSELSALTLGQIASVATELALAGIKRKLGLGD